MKLVVIAALVAACGAAKLDRSYLPPASAHTAGGSPGSLQTPFVGNSFNQGLGGLPKGSFTNDFQGVVVDAAAAGTRASEGESGLGAPRIAYGSTNSKVGDAAFTGFAGFRQGNQQAGHIDTDVHATGQAGGFNHASSEAHFDSKPERAQASYDRVANTLRYENEVNPESYNFAFETDNGISAEENGVDANGVKAQGGYSYTGDDGQVYSITYTADEGGYQPRGDHLPTPPPIPEEILKSLEQNARDEAAGVVDDGSYDAERYNAGGDYAETDVTHVEQNDRQAPTFGKRPVSDASASGTFINQSNQPFVRPGPNVAQKQTTGSQSFQTGAFSKAQSSHVQNRFGSQNTEESEKTPGTQDFANNAFQTSAFSQSQTTPVQNRFGSQNTEESKQTPATQDFANNAFQTSAFSHSQSTPVQNRFGLQNTQVPGTQGFSNNALQANTFNQVTSTSVQNRFGSQNNKQQASGNNAFQATTSSQAQSSRVQNRFGSQNNEVPEQTSGTQDFANNAFQTNAFNKPQSAPVQNRFGSQSNEVPEQTSGTQDFDNNAFQANAFNKPQSAPVQNTFGSQNNEVPEQSSGSQDFANNAFQSTASSQVQSNPVRNRFGSQNNEEQKQTSRSQDFANNAFQATASSQVQSNPVRNRFGSQNNEEQKQTSGSQDFANSAFKATTSQAQSTRVQNRFGSQNEYLPPGNKHGQNVRPQNPLENIQFNSGFNQKISSSAVSQESQPSTTFGRPTANKFEVNVQNADEKSSAMNSDFQQPSNTGFDAASGQLTQNFGTFGNRNQFSSQVKENVRPQQPISASQGFNQNSQAFASFQSTSQSDEQTTFSQAPQAPTAVPQKQQTGDLAFQNRRPAAFNTQRPTAQPSLELTTPLEPNEQSNTDVNDHSVHATAVTANSQSSGVQLSSRFGSQTKQPASRPQVFTQSQSFSQQSQSIQTEEKDNVPSSVRPTYNQQSGQMSDVQLSTRFGSQTKKPASRPQFSTQSQSFAQQSQANSVPSARPTYNQQQQGPDSSYYYRQPAKPFNTPIQPESRFPITSSGEFNRVTQQSQASAQFSGPSQQDFAMPSFQSQRQTIRGSTRYPQPPTVAPVAPTAPTAPGQYQENTFTSQFNGNVQNSNVFQPQYQGSTKYPKPPTLAPTAPTTPLGGSQQYNRITQATATAFASSAPTFAANFNTQPSFETRPTFQSQTNFQSMAFATSQGQLQADKDDSPSVPTQQYSGEVYEYNKPPETLPAPAKPEPVQNAQGKPKPHFSQFESTRVEQKQQQPRPFGRPSFEAQRPSVQDQPAQGSVPQFNFQPKPFTQSQTRPQNAKPNCCQTLDSKITQLESHQNTRVPGPSFGSQFSGSSAQSAFVGEKEVFSGSRKPPSFDSQTGYHY